MQDTAVGNYPKETRLMMVEKEEEEEVRKMENEATNAILTSGPNESNASSDVAAEAKKRNGERGSSCDVAESFCSTRAWMMRLDTWKRSARRKKGLR